jgi:peptidoglycan/xylan/chitin deacetylase (PgdA/CDA1 family)
MNNDIDLKSQLLRKRKRKKFLIRRVIFLFIMFLLGIFSAKMFIAYKDGKVTKTQTVTANKDSTNDTTDQSTAPSQQTNNTTVSTSTNNSNQIVVNESLAVSVEQAYSYGRDQGAKYVFLTFDDGPTNQNTPKILDILKERDVKATFFILGKLVVQNADALKRLINEGHTIGNHTYNHDYKILYPKNTVDVAVFNQELDKTNEAVSKVLGHDVNLRVIRFPAGSFESYKRPMRESLNSKGKVYIDWNVENMDGIKSSPTRDEQMKAITDQTKIAESKNQNVVILMHDSAAKKTTVQTLPEIIKFYKDKGYKFANLK